MKYMNKKLIAVFVAFMALLTFTSVAQAAVTVKFNDDPQDRPVVRVANKTEHSGGVTNCWVTSIPGTATYSTPCTNSTMQPGEIVTVAVYYHNTGTATAANTRITVSPQSTGSSSSQTLSASVTAGNVTQSTSNSSGSAHVSITGSESLTFIPGSVKWFPSQSTSSVGYLPFGQNGSELFSGGLNIGSVTAGWSSQGSITLDYQVSSTTPSGSAPNVSTLSCSPSQNSITFNGSYNANGASTTTWFEYGTTQNLLSGTSHIQQGSGSSTFSATASGLSAGTTYFYRAVAQNQYGTSYGNPILPCTTNEQSQTIVVDTNTPTTITTSSATLNGAYSFTGASASVYFKWGTSSGNINNVVGTRTVYNQADTFNYSLSGLQSGTTYWYIACGTTSTGINDCGDTRNFTTTDNGNNNDDCRIDDFYASPSTVDEGDNSTLHWSTSECDHVTISPSVNGSASNADGSVSTYDLYSDTTYTLRAYDSDGNLDDTDTLTVNVDDDNNNDNDDCRIDDFFASPTHVSSGRSSELSWETTDCDYVTISSLGTFNDTNDNTDTSNLYYTTSYTLYAYDSNGNLDDTDGVTVYVDRAPINQVGSVSTIVATSITQTSARLNGVVTTPNYQSVQTYFEYGPTTALGFTTTNQTIAGTAATYSYVSGLAPATIYYFRAVANFGGQVVYGNTLSFITLAKSAPYVPPVVISTGGGSNPLVMLTVDTKYEAVCFNDIISYDVKYRNLSSTKTLTNVVLHIQFPENILFIRATDGEFSVKDNTLTINVDKLVPNESDSLAIEAQVNKTAKNADVLVTTGTVTYQYGSVQDQVIVYEINNVSCPATLGLGAFALGAGFLPSSLLGWLLLILIILALIAIAMKVFPRRSNTQSTQHPVFPPRA